MASSDPDASLSNHVERSKAVIKYGNLAMEQTGLEFVGSRTRAATKARLTKVSCSNSPFAMPENSSKQPEPILHPQIDQAQSYAGASEPSSSPSSLDLASSKVTLESSITSIDNIDLAATLDETDLILPHNESATTVNPELGKNGVAQGDSAPNKVYALYYVETGSGDQSRLFVRFTLSQQARISGIAALAASGNKKISGPDLPSKKRKAVESILNGAEQDGFQEFARNISEKTRDAGPKEPTKSKRTRTLVSVFDTAVEQTRKHKATVPFKKYDSGNVTLDKPTPCGRPPVWSIKRQPLCDALPWYRAQQSAAYTSNKVVKGFMIDKEVKFTDRFTTDVIISGCGGGQVMDEKGQRTQQKDQWICPVATYFQTNLEQQLPIGVIAGHGNRISPVALPHRYNVLDWFHVTDVWCEKAPYARWMIRLEKINRSERSWWSPDTESDPSTVVNDSRSVSKTCATCQKSSKEIYVQGWVCLNTGCTNFFNYPISVNTTVLEYTDAFLTERSVFQGAITEPLKPLPYSQEDLEKADVYGVEEIFKRGIVCTKCNCCARRLHWSGWTCENPSCGGFISMRPKPIPIEHVLSTNIRQGSSRLHLCPTLHPSVLRSQHPLGLYTVYDFTLAGEDGKDIGIVRLIKSDPIINQQKDGPNHMFHEMQQYNFYLKRNPVRVPNSSIEVVTSHFTANFGAPYKFAVPQISKSFGEAPDVIIKSLMRMTWAGKQAVTENLGSFMPFNEVLALGYYECSDIGYHDDGEKTLGPTVATLSLGCPAYMSVRPKKGNSIGGGPSKTKNKSDMLKILLEHGDIVVMHGRDIHKYYEHAVKPTGILRFALTCRYIIPETLKTGEEREDARRKSIIPAHLANFVYNGDLDARPTDQKKGPINDTQVELDHIEARVKAGLLARNLAVNMMKERLAKFDEM